MNFDLTTTRLMDLLAQATPEIWRRDKDEPAPGLKVTDDPRSRANVELAVLAPDLARKVIFMRASLAQLHAAMTAIADSDKSSEPDRKLAEKIATQVNQLLADHDIKENRNELRNHHPNHPRGVARSPRRLRHRH